ncbi:MAG: type II toxin-antitoxin system RelE/ParE family toxin [Phycisphaerales bacterium]|nr:MAG: type II toxin-antitoxin system RelE/ParE family toxin [Phycisphaerales bacterium]
MPGLGLDFLAATDAAIRTIQNHPLQHPLIYKNVRRALTRRFPYQIFFVIADDVIVVVAVSHSARDPQH